LDRWTTDRRRIIEPAPTVGPVPAFWKGDRVGRATIHRQRLAGESWHSLGASVEFNAGTFRPEFMDGPWTIDALYGTQSHGEDGGVTLVGPRVIAVTGGRPWAWDDGTLPDPILWEGAD
jgi:hypothetical protein